MRLITGIFAAGVLAACSRQPQAAVDSRQPAVQSGEVACAPAVGSLPSSVSVSSLAGEHRLTLISSVGTKASGTLSLRADGAPARSLVGTSRIALDSVGATAPGRASDVTAVQWERPAGGTPAQEITIRFGSAAAPGQIEGSHTALQLTSLTDESFAGTWTSAPGDNVNRAISGRFCAQRIK